MIFVIHSEPFYLNLKPSLQDKSNYFLIDIKKKSKQLRSNKIKNRAKESFYLEIKHYYDQYHKNIYVK